MPASTHEKKAKGFYNYTAEEGENVGLAQPGSMILKGAATIAGIEYCAATTGVDTSTKKFFPHIKYWVAIKALSRGPVVDSSVIARSLIGDDFMITPGILVGSASGYDAAAGASSQCLDLQAEDMVLGCFDRIRICDAVSYVQAYIG